MVKLNPFKIILREYSKEYFQKLSQNQHDIISDYISAYCDLHRSEESKYDETKCMAALERYYLNGFERECAICKKRLAKKFMKMYEQSVKNTHENIEDIKRMNSHDLSMENIINGE